VKTLLALSALLAAALAAILFPEMKSTLLLIPFALLALFFAGCSSGLAAKLNKMPDGKFATATLEETGKFTHTEIKLSGVVKDNGELSADKITIEHTDPWVVKFKFEATEYQAQLSRAAQKRPLNHPVPHATEAKPAEVSK
jgi:hypothetical protein